jgi:PAS domain S-box-containing protein
MDATIASLQSWELLAQLAVYRQRETRAPDLPALLEHIAEMLQRAFPHPWGVLVVTEREIVRATTAWGLDHDLVQDYIHEEEELPKGTLSFAFQTNQAEGGYLLLAPLPEALPNLDPAFGNAVAAQIGLLIDVHLRDRTERLNAALQRLTHTTGAQPLLEELLQIALTEFGSVVPFDQALVLLPEEDPNRAQGVKNNGINLRPVYSIAPKSGLTLPSAKDSIYQLVLNEQEAQIVTLSQGSFQSNKEQTLAFVDLTGNGLLIPMPIGNEGFGLLIVASDTADRYGAVERDAAVALAKQAGQLIAVNRRYTQQLQRARELFVLYENSQVISSTAQLDQMLDRLLENIALAMNAEACVIGLVDLENPSLLRVAATTGIDMESDPTGQLLSIRETPALQSLLNSDTPHFVNHIEQRSSTDEGVDTPAIEVLSALGFASGVVLSMRTQERPVGLLSIGYVDPTRVLNRADFNLITTLTNQVTTAIVNAQLADSEFRHTSELTQLETISQQLSGNLSFEEALYTLVSGISKLLPECRIDVYTFDRDKNHFRQVVPIAPDRYVMSDDIFMEEGLLGWLSRHRRSLLLNDLEQYSPVPITSSAHKKGQSFHSYLGLPLRVGNELMGALELRSPEIAHFSEHHEHLVNIIVGHAANAIQNTLNFSQTDEHLRWRIEQLSALQRINSQLTMGHFLNDILTFVLEQALRATTATQAYIALYNTKASNESLLTASAYHIVALEGYPTAITMELSGRPLPKDAQTAHKALAQGLPELIDNLQEPESDSITCKGARSLLAVPIFYEAQVVGVIALHSNIMQGFDHDAVEFVRALASQAAIAIGNAQRYEDQVHLNAMLQHRATMLNSVLEIGQALRADHPLEEVLAHVGESVIDATGFRRVIFYLIDQDTPEQMSAIAAAGVPLDDLAQYRELHLPVDMVLRSLDPAFRIGRSIFIPSPEIKKIGDEFGLATFEGTFRSETASDLLLVPLYTPYNRQLIGLLLIDDLHEQKAPTERTVEPLAIFADQAAIAIENIQLVRSAQDQANQMRALFQAGTIAASTLELDALLSQIYAQIETYIGASSRCTLVYYDADRENLQVRHLTSPVGKNNRSQNLIDQALGKAIIEQGESLFIRDLALEIDELNAKGFPIKADKNYRSLLAVPLYSQKRVIGTIILRHQEANYYQERDLTFLGALSHILAIAIENVSLFQEREERLQALAVINQISTIASSTLDLEQMLPQVYECLHEFLRMDAFFIVIKNTGRDDSALYFTVDEGAQSMRYLADAPEPTSLSAYIMHTGEPLLFDNLKKAKLPPNYEPVEFGKTKRSAAWLGVPLIVGDATSNNNQREVLGVISIQSYKPNSYTQRELSFMATVASQIALSAQNALLYAQAEERVTQIGSINHISSVAAATLAADDIYQAAVTAVARTNDVDRIELVLYDRPTATASIVAEHAPGVESKRLTFSLIQNPLVTWMDEHQQPFISSNPLQEPLLVYIHGLLRQMNITAIAFIPLIVGGEVIGTFTLDFIGRQGKFSDTTIELTRTIANQTATAIKNARLFGEAQNNATAFQRKVDELSTLLDAARLLSSSLRPDKVLDNLMELVSRQLNVHTVALWTINSNGMLTPSAMDGIPPEAASTMRVPIGKGMTGQVAATGQPLIVTDVEADGQSLYPDFQRRNGLTSYMGVPVIFHERTIGVLSVMTMDRRDFEADEMLLLAGLADQAAIALENARLFEQRERRINELTTFNAIATSINAANELTDLVKALHDGISDILDTSTSFIGLYEAMSQEVYFEIARINGADVALPPLQFDDPNALTARVVLDMRPLLLRTPDEIAALTPAGAEIGLESIGTYLGVPITTGGDVLGIIVLQSAEPYAFDTEDERFLVTVAGQAATAINRAHLFSDRERRLREVTALKDIGSALVGTLDPNQMAEQLHHELSQVLNTRTSYIGLYNADLNQLSFPVAYKNGTRIVLAPEALKDGPDAWVIRNQAPILSESLELGEQMMLELWGAPLDQKASDYLTESFMIVPISSGDSVLGIINIQSDQARAFNADDLRFVTTAANQAAVSIANARLFSERGRRIAELATFNEIGQALSSTVSIEELPMLIYRQTSRLLKIKNFYMAMVDERSKSITFPLYIEHGEHLNIPPLTEGNSLTEYVVRKREPLLLQGDNILEQIRELGVDPLGEVSTSWLGVPMISADKIVGVIGVQDFDDSQAYGPDDVRLLSTIASWAATALDNARLFQSELNRRTLADTLRDVSQSFTSTLALDEIQSLTIRQLARLVPFDIALIFLRDENQLQLTTGEGIPAEQLQDQPCYDIDEYQLLKQLTEERVSLFITDLEKEPEYKSLTLSRSDGQEIRSLIGAPLLVDEETVGILLIGNVEPNAYTTDEVQIAFVLASQASQAIQNARFFDRITNIAAELEQANTELERRVAERTSDLEAEKQRLEAIHSITLELTSSLHMDEILSKALKMVCNTVGAARGSIMLRDPQSGELVCRAVLYDDGEVRAERMPISFSTGGDGLAGWVMEHQDAVRIDNVLQDHRWVIEQGRADEVRSVVAVPLMSNDAPLGVLVLNSPHENFFTEPQVKLLGTIANEVAIAVHNAELYGVINDFASRMGESLMLQREEFSKTRAILQSVTEGVIVLDEAGKITLFNPAAELILGISASTVRDKPFDNLTQQGETEGALRRAQMIYDGISRGFQSAKDRNGIYSIALELPEPTQTIAVNLAPVVGNDGRPYGDVAVLRDVTREIEAERAKRSFISGVSHELRTPLTSIKGFVDLLLSGLQGPLTEAQSYSLGVVKTNSNRLMDLINDILTISSIESGKIELQMSQVQIHDIINDVLQSLTLEAERKRLQVALQIDEDLPDITADKRRLTQVVFNLFSNAVKYTFEGGNIAVRAFRNPAGLLQVEVEDTGVGMSPDQMEKLFRPFYRADNPLREEAGGTGLGLSIAKSLIEEHGGELWPTSELGKGSVFHFVIPVQQAKATSADRDIA